MPTPIRAVLFDVAGTLIELREPVGRTYARVAALHGGHFDAIELDQRFREAIRRAPPRWFPRLTPERVASQERSWWRDVVFETFDAERLPDAGFDAAGCFDALFALYGGPATWRRRPGARYALTELRSAGLLTGVISNFDHRLPDLLEALGFNGLLDVVVFPQRSGAAKPDRALFEAALDALEIRPAEAIYVGDDPEYDLEAGRAAGLNVIDASEDGLRSLPARIAAQATLVRPTPSDP